MNQDDKYKLYTVALGLAFIYLAISLVGYFMRHVGFVRMLSFLKDVVLWR